MNEQQKNKITETPQSAIRAGKKLSIFGDSAVTPDLEGQSEKNQFFAELSGPLHVAWEVTRRCPLKCLHCLNNCSMDKISELNHKDARQLAGQIIEVKPYNLCFCGGEPFLREDLLDIAKKISSHGIGISMVTSGLIPISQDKAEKIRESGITNLQVSIDGAKAKTHERMRGIPGCFEKTIASAKNVVKSGINLAIAYTPTKFNIPEFSEFVDMAIELGCRNIRIMPVMPLGRALFNEKELFPSGNDYLKLVWTIKQKQYQYVEKNAVIEWGDPLEHIYSYAFAQQIPFSMDVDKDGSIILSPYLPIVFGNIKKHTLKEYWDRGLRKMWTHPKMLELARNAVTMDKLHNLSPRPYLDPHIILDLFEELN